MTSDNLLVGSETNDDALVYRLTADLAIVQTIDFFPPMVDDPYLFGQIAAANALSDIYAMGAKPAVAMNMLCFPSCLDVSVAREILRGGAEKAGEADCVIAGGHSITDEEPKYGLCVTGLVHPSRILRNRGAEPGDLLILTKKVGTGAVLTGCKNALLSEEDAAETIRSMRMLNRRAAEIAADFKVHACTDVTGFGVAGHCCEMAEASAVTAVLTASALPLLAHAQELAREGMLPGGMDRNREYFIKQIAINSQVPEALADLFFDPQTSGGLLFAIPASESSIFLEALRKEIPAASVIGEIKEKSDLLLHIL